MYQIDLRRQAYGDLETIPADHARLITRHIDLLEENARPHDSKKLKDDAGYSLHVGIYRGLKDIDDKVKTVTTYRIKHRPEAYRQTHHVTIQKNTATCCILNTGAFLEIKNRANQSAWN